MTGTRGLFRPVAQPEFSPDFQLPSLRCDRNTGFLMAWCGGTSSQDEENGHRTPALLLEVHGAWATSIWHTVSATSEVKREGGMAYLKGEHIRVGDISFKCQSWGSSPCFNEDLRNSLGRRSPART